jgi:glyoxylase-like metal-dependent hydrolase (beta-lactamase superfamily II)
MGRPKYSAALLKMVADQSPANRVQALFNTDWYQENTGSNETLGKAGAKIIAHENTKLWLTTDIVVEWQKRTYKPRAKEALPSQTFYTTGKMTFGKEEIRYGYLGQAHTDGDIYVFFPGPNVLMTGDVFSAGMYPIPDYCTNGWLGGLVTATKTLVGLTDAKTRVIPGTGPVQSRGDLEAQYEMCNTMKTRLAEMMKQGKGANEIIAAAPTAEFDKKWAIPRCFCPLRIVAYGVTSGSWAVLFGGIRRTEEYFSRPKFSAPEFPKKSRGSRPNDALHVCRPCRWSGASVVQFRQLAARALQQAPSSAPATQRALARSVLRHLPQRAQQDSECDVRHDGSGESSKDAKIWERAVRKLRGGMMPLRRVNRTELR